MILKADNDNSTKYIMLEKWWQIDLNFFTHLESNLEYCAAVVHFHTAYFIQYPRKQKENPTFWTVKFVKSEY